MRRARRGIQLDELGGQNECPGSDDTRGECQLSPQMGGVSRAAQTSDSGSAVTGPDFMSLLDPDQGYSVSFLLLASGLFLQLWRRRGSSFLTSQDDSAPSLP